MRYGVTLGAVGDGRRPRELAELAALAEASGWDGMFLEDYVVYQGQPGAETYDTWISLAAMATATSRIRVGTTVVAVPRRKPWELAAQAVAVDHLSDGRLILGVGAGDVGDPGFAAVGEPVDARIRAELLDEGLAIVAALWSGEPVHFSGRHFRVDGLRMTARPIQRPRIPIWVGGDLLVPGVRRRLARWDGACVYKGPPGKSIPVTPDDVHAMVALVVAERGGAEGYDVRLNSDADRRLMDEYEAAGATWCNQWVPPGPAAATRSVIAAGPARA